MVSLVLYSSGSGGVMVLVSGNNAAAVLVVLCSWNIGGRRKGPTYYSQEYNIVRKYTRSHKLL